MRLVIWKVIQGIFYSNAFMALCAIAWSFSTLVYTLDDFSFLNERSFYPLFIVVFSGVLFVYNLARSSIFTEQRKTGIQNHDQEHWVKGHPEFTKFLVILGLLGMVVPLFWLPLVDLWPLAIAGFLVLLYYWPLSVGVNFKLRRSGILKNIVIGVVWALITVLFPATVMDISGDNQDIYLLMAERFLFIFTIMLPFDLTDVDADQQQGVQTLPFYWGTKRTKVNIGLMTLLLAIIMMLNYSWPILAFQMMCLVYILILLISLNQERSDLYFLSLWDGAIFLQAIMVILGEILH